MHCRAQSNNTNPEKRDPDSWEAQSRIPLLDHANGTHPNQYRLCFLLFHASSTLSPRRNILVEQAGSAQGDYDAHSVENWRQEKPFELLGVVPNLATVSSSDHSQQTAINQGYEWDPFRSGSPCVKHLHSKPITRANSCFGVWIWETVLCGNPRCSAPNRYCARLTRKPSKLRHSSRFQEKALTGCSKWHSAASASCLSKAFRQNIKCCLS